MNDSTVKSRPAQLVQLQGKVLRTDKFEINMQGFAYCSNADWEAGKCAGSLQFTPGKSPLHIWMNYALDQVYVGGEVDASFIIQSMPQNEVIWDAAGRLKLEFVEGIISISFGDDTSAEAAPYPEQLKSLPRGRYTYLASIVTADGSQYAERLLPFIIR